MASPSGVSEEFAAALRASAEETEKRNRLTPVSIDALRRTGAFALRTPRPSGADATPLEVAERLTALGRSCPSAAWVAGTCATTKSLFAKNFGEDAPEEAFSNPDALACGSGVPSGTATRVGDNVHINGRWANISGCEDADWASVAVMADGIYSWAFLPLDRLRIEQTWEMAGMRGTGSHTAVADDVVLPARWVVSGQAPARADQLASGLTVLAPVVGATLGALDVIGNMFASDRTPFMSNYSRMADSDGARHWLAEADRLTHRAERTMLAVATAISGDTAVGDAAATRAAADLADAARDCRAAVDLMLDLHGASGFRTTNALQRLWRDVSVGSRHPLLNPYLAVERLGVMTTTTNHRTDHSKAP
ncbi:alkylation response protein AidB-like acyl-CoA dehydrogenase [Amycolatopsis echigonensis]|uniref:Alkylation response protein AidB-like acyl-CoA dehydrogenase n=1 Tax=Amycolatopsis echigonensis TaxID=2576905 RepID=A0A2N3X1V4_9PSEU|nr:acyl-CoA dehydrogenase [Amycolatopsis niigatensis]PKW00098.1 alkylation response protein AidB-like acyl-CoA dehydrogenase [Amycolatopsis niigatensis]